MSDMDFQLLINGNYVEQEIALETYGKISVLDLEESPLPDRDNPFEETN